MLKAKHSSSSRIRPPEMLLRRLIQAVREPSSEFSSRTDTGHVLLDTVLDGDRYQLVRRPADSAASIDVLTPREKEISRMVALGYPNKTIAAVLEISAWTVSAHLRHAFAKLGVASRAALVAKMMGTDGLVG